MWATLRVVALPLQGAAGPSPRVWGALLVGARLSFPKSSATLAVNQARLSKEQQSWRSWSHLCRWGRSRGDREASAQQEGRSPCRLVPPAGDHLTAPRVSGQVGTSTGRQELPTPLSAGHPCPGNQHPPREGVTREQDAAARPGTQGPQGRLRGGSQQLPGPQERAADEGQMVPPPPGPPRSPHHHPHPRGPQRRRQEDEQGWGWSAGASA